MLGRSTETLINGITIIVFELFLGYGSVRQHTTAARKKKNTSFKIAMNMIFCWVIGKKSMFRKHNGTHRKKKHESKKLFSFKQQLIIYSVRILDFNLTFVLAKGKTSLVDREKNSNKKTFFFWFAKLVATLINSCAHTLDASRFLLERACALI